MDIEKLSTEGIVFKGSSDNNGENKDTKVKTKAKKKAYVSANKSGAAKMRADYRRKRANRQKSKS